MVEAEKEWALKNHRPDRIYGVFPFSPHSVKLVARQSKEADFSVYEESNLSAGFDFNGNRISKKIGSGFWYKSIASQLSFAKNFSNVKFQRIYVIKNGFSSEEIENLRQLVRNNPMYAGAKSFMLFETGTSKSTQLFDP